MELKKACILANTALLIFRVNVIMLYKHRRRKYTFWIVKMHMKDTGYIVLIQNMLKDWYLIKYKIEGMTFSTTLLYMNMQF